MILEWLSVCKYQVHINLSITIDPKSSLPGRTSGQYPHYYLLPSACVCGSIYNS